MKPDFEKAAMIKYPHWQDDKIEGRLACAFLAGCEHAYSIDKEIIERLEKENAELKAFIRGDIKRIEIAR